MRFEKTPLEGAYIIEMDLMSDERGFFARSFCLEEMATISPEIKMAQGSISYNKVKGTLRGMHFQKAPYEEIKVVRCTSGALFDVIVDIRKDSKTYGKWFGLELSAENRKALLIPKGFAHGFLTLKDNTEIHYIMSEFYKGSHYAGLKWNDPAVGIKWPFDPVTVSPKDSGLPLLADL